VLQRFDKVLAIVRQHILKGAVLFGPPCTSEIQWFGWSDRNPDRITLNHRITNFTPSETNFCR